jgi:outer membrane protein assembly factor BamB
MVGAERLWDTPPILIGGDTVYLATDKSLLAFGLETGRQLWAFSADAIADKLRADDRHVYVVTRKDSLARKGTLHALALSTGQEQWSKGVSGSPDVVLIHDGVVYAGSEPLYALDAVTGKQLWSAKGLGSAELIYGGRIFSISETVSYFGTNRVDQGYLSAIDAKTGKLAPSK